MLSFDDKADSLFSASGATYVRAGKCFFILEARKAWWLTALSSQYVFKKWKSGAYFATNSQSRCGYPGQFITWLPAIKKTRPALLTDAVVTKPIASKG